MSALYCRAGPFGCRRTSWPSKPHLWLSDGAGHCCLCLREALSPLVDFYSCLTFICALLCTVHAAGINADEHQSHLQNSTAENGGGRNRHPQKPIRYTLNKRWRGDSEVKGRICGKQEGVVMGWKWRRWAERSSGRCDCESRCDFRLFECWKWRRGQVWEWLFVTECLWMSISSHISQRKSAIF